MLNGIIAIASVVLAIFYAGGPDKVEVREWRLTWEASFYNVAVHLDPVFVVYSDNTLAASGFAWFNTIVLNERLRGAPEEQYILHHEMNHTRQFYALGLWYYPAQLFLPMEWWPSHEETRWDHPEDNDLHQWIPPRWLHEWHMLTLELRLG
jgi:hypothetical protein